MVRTLERGIAGSIFLHFAADRSQNSLRIPVRLDRDDHAASDRLSGRNVIRTNSRRNAGQVFEPDFSNDADNRQPFRIPVNLQKVSWICRTIHPLSDGIGAGPEPRRQSLIDDDGARCSFVIVIVEVSSADQRRPHRFEVAGSDH